MTTGKTIALTRQTFVGKVMFLLFNMLSRLVITFLPRNKGLLISWLQSPSQHFANKCLFSWSYSFSSSHTGMWELDHKEGWALMNWCFQIVLEKTLESPLNSKEIKSVTLKRNRPWIFIGRIDPEAEPILWTPDENNWLTGGDPGPGKDWGQEEKRVTEDVTSVWHHRFDGHEFA